MREYDILQYYYNTTMLLLSFNVPYMQEERSLSNLKKIFYKYFLCI